MSKAGIPTNRFGSMSVEPSHVGFSLGIASGSRPCVLPSVNMWLADSRRGHLGHIAVTRGWQ